MPTDLPARDVAIHPAVAAEPVDHGWAVPSRYGRGHPTKAEQCTQCGIWRTPFSETTWCPGAEDTEPEVKTHPAVAALLAVTPIDPEDGTVIVGFAPMDSTSFNDWGAPEPIAARQAAAVLRWAARDVFRLSLCAEDAAALDELADEIEAAR